MKFTSNQRLNKYLLKWHELTFQNETMFEHIDKHQKRLDHLENDIIPKLRKYRNSFKSEMIKDPQMRKDFDEYMRDQKDYVSVDAEGPEKKFIEKLQRQMVGNIIVIIASY